MDNGLFGISEWKVFCLYFQVFYVLHFTRVECTKILAKSINLVHFIVFMKMVLCWIIAVLSSHTYRGGKQLVAFQVFQYFTPATGNWYKEVNAPYCEGFKCRTSHNLFIQRWVKGQEYTLFCSSVFLFCFFYTTQLYFLFFVNSYMQGTLIRNIEKKKPIPIYPSAITIKAGDC